MRKEPLAAHAIPKANPKSRRAAPLPGPTEAEVKRDQVLFRSLKRACMGEEEKRRLLAHTKDGYRSYQRALITLAQKHGLKIREPKD